MKSSAATANDEAFAAGKAARAAGEPRSANPEAQYSARAFNWDNGWLMAETSI